MVKGKGLYCVEHKPNPGETNKLMSHSEVISYFVDYTGLSRVEVKQMFVDLSALAARELKTGGEFVFPGFGRLVKAKRKARRGCNPITGEEIHIPSRTIVRFRLGKTIKGSALSDD
jgi:Bacterial nucleoid DNA-binding protein